MRKILLYISLLLNLLFIAALIWSVMRYGGLRAVIQKLTNPGVVVNYQNQKAMYAEFPVPPGAIVFLGNSLTEAGHWAEWFGSPVIYNRGIPGDHCDGIRERLTVALGPEPQAVFLMAGINDLAYHDPQTVVKKYEALVDEIHTHHPAARLYLLSILPVNNKAWYVPIDNQAIDEVNAAIRKLAEKLKVPYVDLHQKMAGTDGQLRKELTVDGVHLTAEGYKIWLEGIRMMVETELANSQEQKTRDDQ
ncbi:MAG: GDSL family lipase [Bacteroidetes bacterium]|nr:MAG: GDSL family lipase [Bacteroidota bacterium]